MSIYTTERLKKKRDVLQKHFDILNEKIDSLRQSEAIETDPSCKFKITDQRKKAEQEQKQIEQKLSKLESQNSKPIQRKSQLKRDYDVLIIDDGPSWRELIEERCQNLYKYLSASDYQTALKKIRSNKYQLIFMNLTLIEINYGRKLLELLNKDYSNIPVVLTSGNFKGSLLKLQQHYPNIKEIFAKGQNQDDMVIEEIDDILRKYITNTNKIKGEIKPMILELLTKETIAAGVKFLFERFAKTTDKAIESAEKKKLVEEKKQAIETAIATVKTEGDVLQVKGLMQEMLALIPDSDQLTSLTSFSDWLNNQVTINFDYLPELGILTTLVVEEKRKNEQNKTKKEALLELKANLQTAISKVNEAFNTGEEEDISVCKKKLFKLLHKAADLLGQ